MLKQNFTIFREYWFLNLFASIMLGLQYFQFVASASFGEYVFLFVALVSNTFCIYLIFFVFCSPLLPIKNRHLFSIFIFVVFTFVQLLILSDIAVFKIFKTHISNIILDLLITPRSWENMHLNFNIKIAVAVLVFASFLAEWLVLKRVIKRREKDGSCCKFAKYVFAIFFIFLIADKLTYAYAIFFNKTNITRHTKLFPLYQPFLVKDLDFNLKN